jgi:hypothetical protein
MIEATSMTARKDVTIASAENINSLPRKLSRQLEKNSYRKSDHLLLRASLARLFESIRWSNF